MQRDGPWCARVYPRVCGGAVNVWLGSTAWLGLSPRVRGSRRPYHEGRRRQGSIPACAGEPLRVLRAEQILRVYPRVCGGAFLRLPQRLDHPGLSPRVRGSRELVNRWVEKIGSIPACAGEPRTMSPSRARGRVYPRVCGGAGSRSVNTYAVEGLSPRVRGSPRHG